MTIEQRLNQGEVDRRFCAHKEAVAKLHRADDQQQFPNIIGLAACFYNAADPGTEYELYQDFYERILPGAFDRAIREQDDVRCLFNHDANMILGRSTAGTLKLSINSHGLHYEADPPENQVGKFVTMAIERKDVTGSSFAFVVDEQVLRMERRGDREVMIREIVSLTLYDVAPVTYPAYEATSVTLSSRSAGLVDDFRTAKRGGYPVALALLKRMRANA